MGDSETPTTPTNQSTDKISPGRGPSSERGRGNFRGRGMARGGPRGGFMRGRGGPFMGRGGPGGPNMSRGGPPGRGGAHFGRGGGPGPRGGPQGGPGVRRDFVMEKLSQIQGPTHELPSLDLGEKKFSGRARLYIGNLTPETTEEQLKELVAQYGEVGEIFFNREKHFAFLRLSCRAEAERAKRELDGQTRNGRALKVRFAPHQGAIKVSNLNIWVSNELLHRAFSIFGEIERCVVLVDDRGRSKGEAIVEFERKGSATEAEKRCREQCFFITSSLRPVVVEAIDENDDDDGLQEKMLPKRNPEFQAEREVGPRFAEPNSFEHEYGQKWKVLFERKKQKLDALEQEMKIEMDKLGAQMEFAKYEHETEQLRNQLRMREANREQQKSHWEEQERQMTDQLRETQERTMEADKRMRSAFEQQDENLRHRQQENSLFMQAQEINNMLDQQEAELQQGPNFMKGGPPDGGFGPSGPGPVEPFDGPPNPRFPGGNFGGPPGPPGPGPNFRGGYGGPRPNFGFGGPRGNFRGGGDFGPNHKRRRF